MKGKTDIARLPERRLYNLAQRILDVLGAALSLLLLSPLLLLTVLLIRLDSSGPVLFTQLRVGKRGRPFSMYKFRSMHTNAEHLKNELWNRNGLKGPLFKIRGDPRITRVGRLLRRFSLDELPQLANVLKGEMSLVGPRPLPFTDIEAKPLEQPLEPCLVLPEHPSLQDAEKIRLWLLDRQRVRPGITGLWQVSGRSELPLEGWMRYDLEYIEKHSLWLDLLILLKTIPVVLSGKGAL